MLLEPRTRGSFLWRMKWLDIGTIGNVGIVVIVGRSSAISMTTTAAAPSVGNSPPLRHGNASGATSPKTSPCGAGAATTDRLKYIWTHERTLRVCILIHRLLSFAVQNREICPRARLGLFARPRRFRQTFRVLTLYTVVDVLAETLSVSPTSSLAFYTNVSANPGRHAS